MMSSKQKINVAVIDDQSLFRDGLISLLEEFVELRVVLEAANGKELIDALNNGKKVNVALLDIEMPVMDGIQAAEVVRKKYPDIRILAITSHDDLGFINHFYEIGANGFLLKDSSAELIFEAISHSMKSADFFNGSKNKDLKIESKTPFCLPPSLTEKEIEVIGLLSRGFSNKKISQLLFVSRKTVDTHRKNLMKKIGAKNIGEIIAFGIKNKLHLLPIKKRRKGD